MTTDLQRLEKTNPRGRIDVALFRMGDVIGRHKLPNVWSEIRHYWAMLVAALFDQSHQSRKPRRRRAG